MTRLVLYDGPADLPLDPVLRSQIIGALLDKGIAVQFCGAGSQPAADSQSATLQINGMDVTGVIEAAEKLVAGAGAAKVSRWKPWFPVIDYGRCTNCMQCLSFCLFDVYGVSADRKIEVRNQSNCKTECPACSRVCPEVAIMFPKYRHSPINGDQVTEDDTRREAMKVDISALLGGDVYSLLRDRSAKAQSRFSKERDDQRALKERQNCLTKLQQQMDIPMEVLSSPPSIDEIRAKAEQAAARAREATEAS